MAITHVLSATTPDDPGFEIQPQHWNSAHAQQITIVGNTAGASTISGTNIVFSAGPNVTLSVNGESLVWSGGAGAAGNTGYLSAGTTNASLGTVSFANGNGISFGVDGQTITAAHNALTTAMASNRGSDFIQAVAVFHGTSASGTIASGAISVSIGPYITTGALSNHSHGASAANGSFGFQTLSFSNANGVSFGTSAGSAITASHNGLTTAAASDHSHGNPTLNLTNLSGTTASNSAGLTLSLSAAATVPETPFGVSAGTQSVSTGTLVFSNSNGITFGMSGSSRVTASHDGLTSQSNQNVTAGNGGFAFQTLSFSNVNGFSFGTSAGSAITGSYTVPAAQTGISGVQVSNTTYTSGTITFQNANGISFGSSGANGISASYTVPTQSNQTGGVYHVGNTTGQSSSSTYDLRTLSIDGAGIVSAGWSNGTIRISATQSNQAFSADASSTFQTLTFQNSNGISFSNNGGAIRLTHDLAGTSTGFAGANISGSMTHNSAGLNLSLSVAAPGAAAENNNINLLGANTAGNTTASGSTIGWSGINVTLSGTNGSIVNISAPATSSLVGTSGISISTAGSTISVMPKLLSGFDPWNGPHLFVISAAGNASLSIRPVDVPAGFQYDRMAMLVNYTQSTASTVTMSVSVGWGFYTRNGASLSLHKSGSGSFSVNGSGTASSANNSGNRVISFGSTDTITAGNYYLGLVLRTSSAGGANQTLNVFCVSQYASTISGYLGVATNTRMQYHPAGGVWTSTTVGAPNSIAFSDIRGNSSAFQRQPVFHFTSGEVTF